jgi:hypothetical protein
MQAGSRQALHFHPHGWATGQIREGRTGLQARMWTAAWGRLGTELRKPNEIALNAVDD